MLNNVSFSVTNRCNSHCKICNIWKIKSFENEMSVAEMRRLFSHKCFSQVDTVSLTGGEAFLRDDITDVICCLKDSMPKLHRLFLNTNATNISRVVQVCTQSTKLFADVILSVSLDGKKEVHNHFSFRHLCVHYIASDIICQGDFCFFVELYRYFFRLPKRTWNESKSLFADA